MTDTPKTPKKARAPRQPKPVVIVFQVMNDDGSPNEDFDKKNFNIVGAYKDAGDALDIMEGGSYPGAMYKRVTL